MKPIPTNSSKVKKIIFILAALVIAILIIIPISTTIAVQEQGSGGGGGSSSLNITNPLGGTNDISALVSNIINFLIILAFPITAILIVYAGFLYITSAGNDEKVKTAQKALIWAIVGFAIVLVASSVPTIIEEFLSGESTSTAPIIYGDPELPSGPGLPTNPLPAI